MAKSEPSSQPESRLGSEVDGRYRLLSVIGHGAMGTVYRVRHLALDRVFAMKVMNPRMAVSDEMGMRFRREAMAAASIGHPHIVDVTDMGELDDGTAFIVMEHLSGTDLATHVAELGALSVRDAVRMARQLCSALEAVHARRIVHRDLKPENLMLVHSQTDDILLKVLDFGICKLLDPPNDGPYAPLTRTQVTMGTPNFMAPEQFATDTPVDARADIHAAGAILYFALTGRPLFDARSLAHLCMRITVDPPPSVVALRPDVPRELDGIIRRACAKRPEARFQSAGEMLAALVELGAAEGAVEGATPGERFSGVRSRPLDETMDSVPVLRELALGQATEREVAEAGEGGWHVDAGRTGVPAPIETGLATGMLDPAPAAPPSPAPGEVTAFESYVARDRQGAGYLLWSIALSVALVVVAGLWMLERRAPGRSAGAAARAQEPASRQGAQGVEARAQAPLTGARSESGRDTRPDEPVRADIRGAYEERPKHPSSRVSTGADAIRPRRQVEAARARRPPLAVEPAKEVEVEVEATPEADEADSDSPPDRSTEPGVESPYHLPERSLREVF